MRAFHLLLLALLFSACGPIGYIREVSRTASDEFDAAEDAGAEKHATYYWALSREYLMRARLEASRSRFELARRYGEKASRAARKARERALERASLPPAPDEGEEATEPSAPDSEPAPEQSPEEP